MIKVGITGGIGTGKTTICQLFELLGVPVYYADDRAKRLMTGNKVVKSQIIELLGQEAFFRNGRLDRKYISAKVFNDKKLLNSLNNIVHPAVGLDFQQWASQHSNSKYVLKEAALLIESGSYKSLDKLILVTADKDLRISRVVARDKTTEAQVQKRIEAQMKEEDKTAFADYIIDNSGKQGLIIQVKQLHTILMKFQD